MKSECSGVKKLNFGFLFSKLTFRERVSVPFDILIENHASEMVCKTEKKSEKGISGKAKNRLNVYMKIHCFNIHAESDWENPTAIPLTILNRKYSDSHTVDFSVRACHRKP